MSQIFCRNINWPLAANLDRGMESWWNCYNVSWDLISWLVKATTTSHFIDKSPDKNNDHLYSVDQALVLLHYIKTCNSLHCGLEKDLVVIRVSCLLCRIYIDIKVWSAWTCWTARTNCALYLFRLISSYPKDGARGGPYSIMPCSALWRWRAWEISWGWAELVKGCFLTRSILLFFDIPG